MTLFGNVTLVQAALWVAAAGVLLTVIYKLWPFVSKLVSLVDALGDLPDFIVEIKHEVKYNHGSSMKDAVRRMERKLDEHIALCKFVETYNAAEQRQEGGHPHE